MRSAFTMIVVLASLNFSVGQVSPVLKFDDIVEVGGMAPEHSTTEFSVEQWRAILSVYTHDAFVRNLMQPVSGKYTWRNSAIVFQPDFPYVPGQTYHAVFDGDALLKNTGLQMQGIRRTMELTFSIPASESAATSVEKVFPESSVLPENLLRMYIHFSAPMMPGEAYHHIKLFRSDGSPVEKAFLVVDQELWDAERKRFTLLFDPGRIKRGLKSNLEMGAPLKKGEKYMLVVDSTWRDVNGNYLQRSFRKAFSIGGAQRTRLSAQRWELRFPAAGSREDLVIRFDREMDRALVAKYVTLKEAHSADVAGSARMVDDRTWAFTPERAWPGGDYEIAVSPLLEDVAGNNINRAFDLDMDTDKRLISTEPITLHFVITPVAK